MALEAAGTLPDRPASARLADVSTGRYIKATTERPATKAVLIAVALIFLVLFLILPLAAVFVEALRKGTGEFFASFGDPDTLAAVRLTLLVAAIAVPLNLAFGLAAAWAIAKFEFKGKAFLITLIDLPFSVSPVISGLVYVLLFGAGSVLGPWLKSYGIEILFAVPGIVLATIFVTFPFVARELIPLMQDQSTGDEEAALSLGASGWQTFWYVTLPNVKWGLLYGVLLCNARAMGEFGAVLVISGGIQGRTETATLYIFRALDDRQYIGSYSAALVLGVISLALVLGSDMLRGKER